jgi:hypothetical protein
MVSPQYDPGKTSRLVLEQVETTGHYYEWLGFVYVKVKIPFWGPKCNRAVQIYRSIDAEYAGYSFDYNEVYMQEEV